ncbi:indolepyruvate oxidoreductase subunit beta [Wukongibacter baidiensis]|uniref:indolepyruvate oxidoreductase subunit beta n=1 Tax=Wukongibacter baidiensis TaxID=1723361 RepID=UPI003D7F91C6
MATKNILIVGVGGQGTLLTSRVLGNLALDLGKDVKLSEVHGMAQRGGSVVTHVKFGDKVYSPLVEVGEADIVMAFEKLEAIRWIQYLKDDGELIVNNQAIKPMPVITGTQKYPDKIIERLKNLTNSIHTVDALSVAREIGNIRIVNTVLVGALAKKMDIAKEHWIKALKKTVPEKTIDINLTAFEIGYNM